MVCFSVALLTLLSFKILLNLWQPIDRSNFSLKVGGYRLTNNGSVGASVVQAVGWCKSRGLSRKV